jgi:hypothetical protein
MALHYRTEYRLGDRGRVCRSYTGFQAFVAIALDLVFGLFLEFVFATIGLAMAIFVLAVHLVVRILQLYWRAMVAMMTFVISVVTLPFVWIHLTVERLRKGGARESTGDRWSTTPPPKPSWAYGREV